MRQPFTIYELAKSSCANRNPQLINKKINKKSKYGNVKVTFDGKTFDSQKELNFYVGLRVRLKAGEISNLRCQVPYELNPGGTHSLKYLADFVWTENGQEIICDVKGFLTNVYKKKRALMLKVHGITVREV